MPSLKGGKPHTLWLKPGESFRDLDGGPEMVIVPAGEFWMGSKDGEGDANERPRHKVKIPKPFAVGRYAVTFDEWDVNGAEAAAAFWASERHTPSDQGWGRGRRPVMDVNWDDAQAYIKWLSSKTGQPYRLLSEAEWEYCCRAGTETPILLAAMKAIWTATLGTVRTLAAKPILLARSFANDGACTTCTAMSGNGARIAGTIITMARHRRLSMDNRRW